MCVWLVSFRTVQRRGKRQLTTSRRGSLSRKINPRWIMSTRQQNLQSLPNCRPKLTNIEITKIIRNSHIMNQYSWYSLNQGFLLRNLTAPRQEAFQEQRNWCSFTSPSLYGRWKDQWEIYWTNQVRKLVSPLLGYVRGDGGCGEKQVECLLLPWKQYSLWCHQSGGLVEVMACCQSEIGPVRSSHHHPAHPYLL